MTTELDDMLTAADLTDETTRLVMADALADVGRDDEVALLRDMNVEPTVEDGVVVREWHVQLSHDNAQDRITIYATTQADAEELCENEAQEWAESSDWGYEGREIDIHWVLFESPGDEVSRGSAEIRIGTECSECKMKAADGRLNLLELTGHDRLPDQTIVLCDDCYERDTGLIAVCEDHCSLDCDHVGLCR